MEEKTKGQELYDHYSKTKRTPLSVPYKSTVITDRDAVDAILKAREAEMQDRFQSKLDELRRDEDAEIEVAQGTGADVAQITVKYANLRKEIEEEREMARRRIYEKEPQFENFLLLVDECRGVERREIIMKGILQIEIHSQYLEKLPLSGDELIRIKYSYDKMLLTLRQLLNKPEAKDNKIPSFEKCFRDYDFWTGLMTDPRILDKCESLENNTYKWKGTKEDLAGLAHVLNNRDKLIRTFSGQDLARIFCPYFNVDFKPGKEKSFQPDRAECEKFYYIH